MSVESVHMSKTHKHRDLVFISYFFSLTEISFTEGGETGASGSKSIVINDEVLIGNSKRGLELILVYDK